MPAVETRAGAPRSLLLAGGLLVLAAAMLLLARLGSGPLERAEVYFMDGARSMVERGDYLVPYYRGEPFFDKPPLVYWLIAGSFRLFGYTFEAARLPSVLAALGAIASCLWLGRLLLGPRAALAGGLVLATTPIVLSFGRLAMSDMLLTLASTLAMALAARAVRPPERFGLLVVLGLVLGLGFLTKGPVALLLPGLGIALLAWRHRGRLREAGAVRALLLAAAVCLMVGLGWFALVYARLGWDPLAYFFLHENVERFAGETYDSARAPWYYLLTYLGEGIPWSLLLPAAAVAALRREGEADARPGARLLLGWIGLMAIPLSLARGKIDYYLLPVYPPAALVIGAYLTSPWSRLERAWTRAVVLLLGAGLLGLALWATRLPGAWLPAGVLRGGIALVALAGLGVLAIGVRLSPGAVAAGFAATTAALFLGGVTVVLPALRAQLPNGEILADVVRERSYRPNARVALCQDPTRVQRDLLFEARIAAETHCDLWNPASSRLPYLLLLVGEERASLAGLDGLRVVGEYRYQLDALSLAGLLEGGGPEPLTLVANYATKDPVAWLRFKKWRKRALREEERRRPSPP